MEVIAYSEKSRIFAAERLIFFAMDALTIRKMQFSTLAIGATAKHMGITATELHNRLKRHGLVSSLLFGCYDTLHAESLEGVVWNVEQALRNWDNKEGDIK